MAITPVKNSIIGYWIDIFSLQKWHFPPSIIQDIIGILCHHFRGVLQLWQWEAGNAIFSPFGILYINTFRNEPITTPNIDIIRYSPTKLNTSKSSISIYKLGYNLLQLHWGKVCHRVSVKNSSAYDICHIKKFDILCSPLF